MSHLPKLLCAYWRAKHIRFKDRSSLLTYQQRQLARHLHWVSKHSPFYASYKGLPLAAWPIIDKASMMTHFDQMNTAGLTLTEVMQAALESEQDRDFSPMVRGYTVGLSSGTSGQRGAFVVSAAERAQWAGTILAKLLPKGLFSGERVAFFLRANSNLYTAIQSKWISFQFFDLFSPFSAHLQTLAEYRPTILVAPAQVLRAVALATHEGAINIHPKKVISVAEVLDPMDRPLITQTLGELHEVYQATEGFLACTCAHGVLHLNEEYIHIEPEWLDQEKRRFVPIITDFTRATQPIIRYRLNDVLLARDEPCACGLPTMALDAIEGRCDDMLILTSSTGERVTVFADVISRALAQVLPLHAEYLLLQTNAAELTLYATAPLDALTLTSNHLNAVFIQLGIDVGALKWSLENVVPPLTPGSKRRRIRREVFPF